jgi:hypothetical protein
VQFLQHDELGALGGAGADAGYALRDVCLPVIRVGLLYEAYFEFVHVSARDDELQN